MSLGTPITYDEINELIMLAKKDLRRIKKKSSIDPDFNESMRKVLRDSKEKGGKSANGAKKVIINI